MTVPPHYLVYGPDDPWDDLWLPIETAPMDSTTIVRYHRKQKRQVEVQRNNGRLPGYPEWVTPAMDQAWPDSAFSPHWSDGLSG